VKNGFVKSGVDAPFTFIGEGLIVGDATFKRAYDAIVGYCQQIAGTLGADPIHAAGLLPLSAVRDARYVDNFPQHLLTAKPYLAELSQPAEEYAVSPAACLCVFQLLRGVALPGPRCHAFTVTCGRYEEGHRAERFRLASYNIHEVVCVGDRPTVNSFFQNVRGALDRLAEIFPDTEVVVAHDAFFGPDARSKQFYQDQVKVKFELQAKIGDETVALASVNAHGQAFGKGFDIQIDDDFAFSACFGVGLERATQYALDALGRDPAAWPALEDLR
jgi:hypothetical protein